MGKERKLISTQPLMHLHTASPQFLSKTHALRGAVLHFTWVGGILEWTLSPSPQYTRHINSLPLSMGINLIKSLLWLVYIIWQS